MFIYLDANAFYTYYGREKLGMSANTKLNHEKFVKQMDIAAHKVLPTSVLIEMAVYLRDDYNKWLDIQKFILIKDFQFVHTGTVKSLSDSDIYPLLLAIDKVSHKHLVDNYVKVKIDEEASNIYILLTIIMMEYFRSIMNEKYGQSADEDWVLFFKAVENNLRKQFIELLSSALAMGYQNRNEQRFFTDIFLLLLSEFYVHLQYVEQLYWRKRTLKGIDVQIPPDAFEKIRQQIQEKGEKEAQMVSQKLTNDPWITSGLHKDGIKKSLLQGGYSDIQADYFLHLFDIWSIKADSPAPGAKFKKRKKNDIYDLFFLGCLEQESKMYDFFKNTFARETYNVYDYRSAIITFDELILEFLHDKHKLSYEQSKQYYI